MAKVPDKKTYVVGFLFDPEETQVVLIRKNRPEWQKGKLNGVGGKVEPGEAPMNAMSREFKEEAGVDIPATDWRCFVSMEYRGTMIYFYTARRECEVRTMTDEKVDWHIIEVAHDDCGSLKTLPNLKWLIPLALSKDKVIAEVWDPS